MNKRIFSFVFARGGSKGIPKKNLIKIGGISLLAHSINIAKSAKNIEKIFVSTDCNDISAEGIKYGAEIIERPKELALDSSPEWKAWQHAVKYVFDKYGIFDIFLSLPATSPLRKLEDINNCLEAFDSPKTKSVITITEANRSPWFNMVIKEDKNVKLLIEGQKIIRRQDSPKSYDITTVAYALKPQFILDNKSIWDDKVIGIEVPKERSIDIDTYLDYRIADFLYKEIF